MLSFYLFVYFLLMHGDLRNFLLVKIFEDIDDNGSESLTFWKIYILRENIFLFLNY